MYKCLIMIVFCTILASCANFVSQTSINQSLKPYLLDAKPLIFEDVNNNYEGVIYVFARNINNSSYLCIAPAQCYSIKYDDMDFAFVFDEKLFIGKGDINILQSLIDFRNINDKINLTKWKSCESLNSISDIDVENKILLITNRKKIEEVSLEQ